MAVLAPTTARRVAETLASWLGEERRVVRALLVGVDGSAPLAAGASMLIEAKGEIEGSITGGCIEGALVEEAEAVFRGGPPRLVSYGVSDELAGTVGLSCGGTVRIFVHELRGPAAAVELRAAEAIARSSATAIATMLDGPAAGAKLAVVDGEAIGSLESGSLLDHSVSRDAAGLLAQGATAVRRYGADGSTLGAAVAVHIASFAPPPQMVIFGAIDFSVALTGIAKGVGYHVSVCDPRRSFIESSRFSGADEVLVCWPEEALDGVELGPSDAVLIFSHDPKFDVPAVRAALASGAGYVGALGSRRTTADRRRRLLEAGCEEGELSRLHAPCGLDIGANTPEEVAISVIAEMVAVRTRRGGAPLRSGSGPIHERLLADHPPFGQH